MRRLLLFFLLAMAAHSQETHTANEVKVLDNLRNFYKQVGRDDKVLWLDAQRKAGRIEFGPMAPDVSAECDMITGVIAINSSPAPATR